MKYATAIAVGATGLVAVTAIALLVRDNPESKAAPKPAKPAIPTPPTKAGSKNVFKASLAQLVEALGRAEWRAIKLPSGASVEVMLQPATEGELYLPADYATAEAAAKAIGASLMTPKVMDAVHDQADSRLKPCILPPTASMASREWAEKHSACIRAQNPHGLTSNAGKGWARGLKLGPDQAANHGWYDTAAPNGRLWQDRGRKHNKAHVDYSQTVQLMRGLRDPAGSLRSIDEVLRGSDWAMLGTEQENIPNA